jgi:hypothetical protein
MQQPLLHLCKDFSIPAIDYAGQGNAILGIRDAGKTYTAMKAGEQLMDSQIPIVVYDPVGVWKNLKIGLGKHKGYSIVVAGGEGSDIRLTPGNAVDIIRAAMKENISIIFDLYSPELINKSTWIKIVQETVDVLMYENKLYGMRHAFLEEAAEFIPQRLQPQHARVYASLERLARMGRNAKLGMTIINQRAEEVNKAILEICAFSLLHKQVGKNSLKSIQQWLELRQLENVPAIIKSLPGLKQGECWAIGQSEQPKLITITPRNTFHPDPKKHDDQQIKKVAVDVSGFVDKMNKQLIKKEAPKKQSTSAPALTRGDDHLNVKVKDLEDKLRASGTTVIQLSNIVKGYEKMIKAIAEIVAKAPEKSDLRQEYAKSGNNSPKTEINARSSFDRPASSIRNAMTAGGGAMRMLKAAAMFHPKLITKTRMAALARLSYSSGSFSTYLSSLKRDGLLTGEGNEYMITSEGLAKAGDVDPLPTDPKELVELWCDILGSQGGASRILRTVAAAYPEDVCKEDLGKETQMSHTSGSFSTYLSTLKRNGLISTKGAWVKASDELFN